MDIINFETMADDVLSATDFTVHRFLDGKYGSKTDVVIIGIDSILNMKRLEVTLANSHISLLLYLNQKMTLIFLKTLE